MNLPVFIAKRYLFAKKSHNIINIISYVNVVGIALGTLALIVVLSVYNGFDDFVKSLYTSFDSDLKITAVEGKTFDSTLPQLEQVRLLKGVGGYAEVVEDNVLLSYELNRKINDDDIVRNKQFIATIKGVSSSYLQTSNIDQLTTIGSFELQQGDIPLGVLGRGIVETLGVHLGSISPIQVWAPKRGKKLSVGIDAMRSSFIYTAGIFEVDKTTDSKYFFTSIDFARELLGYTTEVSSIEIRVVTTLNPETVKKDIENILGSSFQVKTRYQQNETLYRVMLSEKFAIYLILSFILIIVSLNIVGSLSMVMVDKKKDIAILQSLGATSKLIKRIFLLEGWLTSIIGAVIGLALGLLICWLQITFGLVSMPEGFLIDSYPVKVDFMDVCMVFGLVILIGYLIARLPVSYLSKRMDS